MKSIKVFVLALALLLSFSMLYAADAWEVKKDNTIEKVFKIGFMDRNPLTATVNPKERNIKLTLSSVKGNDYIYIEIIKKKSTYRGIEEVKYLQIEQAISSSSSKNVVILDSKEYYNKFFNAFSSNQQNSSDCTYQIKIEGSKGKNSQNRTKYKDFVLKDNGADFVALVDNTLNKIGGTTYKIGDRGPAGGYVFYDKGKYENGWRYMEVTPNDVRGSSGIVTCDINFKSEDGERDYYSLPDYYVFGYSENLQSIRSTFFGLDNIDDINNDGRKTTEEIIDCFGDKAKLYEPGLYQDAQYTESYGALLCDKLEYNGYDDWFLPSFKELLSIYDNLQTKGIGDFSKDPRYSYMSSNEYEGFNFVVGRSSSFNPPSIGFHVSPSNGTLCYVRAVRKF